MITDLKLMATIRRQIFIGGGMRWCLILLIAIAGGELSAAPSWQASLSKEPAGDFPPLRSLHASYIFGWSGFTAATADVQFANPSSERCQLQGSGRTIGLARAL